MSSLGHVFAATFCPHGQGRECCLAQTANHKHISGCVHETMAMKDMVMDDVSMNDARDEVAVPNATLLSAGADNDLAADRLDQPIESCAHCLTHSGLANSPVSFVIVTDQSYRAVSPLAAPALRFAPPTALARVGLPSPHGPPGSRASRHLLMNVFLI
jgi:hypothetical protein